MANYQPVRLAYIIIDPVDEVDPRLSPVIFLHAITSSKEHWGDIAQKVANATKRRAYTLDARNHGDSEWTDYFNFDVNADDVINFMDSNGISKAILIGHSMGGITAVKAALRWPERIEKIIVEDMLVRKLPKELTAPVLLFMSASRKAIEDLPADLEEMDAKKFIIKQTFTYLPLEMTEMVKEQPQPAEDKMDFMRIRRSDDGRFQFNANIDVIEKAVMNMESLSSDPSGMYEGAALFIYGNISPFAVGSDEEHIKMFFPNAVLEGVEGCGHDIHWVNPEKFIDSVIKFLF